MTAVIESSGSQISSIAGNGFRSIRKHPECYSEPKANSRAFGAGHLDLAIVEHIPAAGLVFGQIVRLDNLNPAGADFAAFQIVLNGGGDVHELEHQVVREFVRSQGINRRD